MLQLLIKIFQKFIGLSFKTSKPNPAGKKVTESTTTALNDYRLNFLNIPFSDARIAILPTRVRIQLKHALQLMENRTHSGNFVNYLIEHAEGNNYQIFLQFRRTNLHTTFEKLQEINTVFQTKEVVFSRCELTDLLMEEKITSLKIKSIELTNQ